MRRKTRKATELRRVELPGVLATPGQPTAREFFAVYELEGDALKTECDRLLREGGPVWRWRLVVHLLSRDPPRKRRGPQPDYAIAREIERLREDEGLTMEGAMDRLEESGPLDACFDDERAVRRRVQRAKQRAVKDWAERVKRLNAAYRDAFPDSHR